MGDLENMIELPQPQQIWWNINEERNGILDGGEAAWHYEASRDTSLVPGFSLSSSVQPINPTVSTISKRDKKRAQDRIAQRSARQRTKDRLASLELQVSELQDGADNSLTNELKRMRKERDDLRVLSNQLLAVAGAVKTTLDSSDNSQRLPASVIEDRDTANSSLMCRIFHDYEALKTVGPTIALPLSDAHVFLNGILNGWDG